MHVCMYDVILNKTKVMIHSQEEEDDATWVCLTWRHSVEEMNLRPLMFLHISTKADVREDLHIRINIAAFELVAYNHFLHSLFDQMQKRNIIQNFKDHERALSHLHNSRRPYLKTTTSTNRVYIKTYFFFKFKAIGTLKHQR